MRKVKLLVSDPWVTCCSACGGGAGTGEGARPLQEHSGGGKRWRYDDNGKSCHLFVSLLLVL